MPQDGKKKRMMGTPKFLRHLDCILTTEDPSIISWTADGSCFQLFDVKRLENEVLPKYFKHNKLASFQRQLNYFGFRKWTKTQSCVCTFSHPQFNRYSSLDTMNIGRKQSSPEYFKPDNGRIVNKTVEVDMLGPLEELDVIHTDDWNVCIDLLAFDDDDWIKTEASIGAPTFPSVIV
ncbi:hypothetical protein AC1031_003455 [Aphanomyces cochlioides]|nr:hypothetical protein AC1031_003455 [Aphanomyces cochlioides]